MDKKLSQPINLNGKTFKAVSNSENGEVSEQTVFKYFQKENIIGANYNGGEIIQGHLLGQLISENILTFSYHHINKNNEILTGKCTSTCAINADGKYLLYEEWQWTCKDYSKGQSTLIESI